MRNIKGCCALLLAGSFLLTGCASTPKAQMIPQTATGLVELRHALASGKINLERTSEALRDLMKSPRYNTSRQIDAFIREMDALDEVSEEVRDINTRIQSHADEHLAAWNRELTKIKNPDIAAKGQARQQHTQATLEAIRATMDKANTVVTPYITNLEDMARYLKEDPTAEGVESLKPIMRKTLNLQSKSVQMLNEVIAHIDEVTKSVQ